jgi:hypothetical protein
MRTAPVLSGVPSAASARRTGAGVAGSGAIAASMPIAAAAP